MIIKQLPPVTPPNIVADKINQLEVCLQGEWSHEWHLKVNGNRWNTWNILDHSEMIELISSSEIAYGKVIATGLGFCLRESMLLANPRVEEIIVLEKHPDVIKYHEKHNPQIMSKMTVIECDANEYIGECDTLLLDHYEIYNPEHQKLAFEGIYKCSSNISHKVSWAWALESLTETYEDYLDVRQKGYKFPYMSKKEYEFKKKRFFGYKI